MERVVFRFESARATLFKLEDGTAKVTNVHAQMRGQGHATAVLSRIIEYADKHQLPLWLEVQRYGHPRGGLTNAQLLNFYSKFGFVLNPDERLPRWMSREPVKGDVT
jgi:GNAT superfamily N-acetyltransferase